MSLWISLPCSDEERMWLERLGLPLRLSRDHLWRTSGVEAAFVSGEVWKHWKLPEPPAPIVSIEVSDLTVVDEMLSGGARWASPIAQRDWGVRAGFLRLPSGLLLEITLTPPATGAARE